MDDDPILGIAGRPGDIISWAGFFDTTSLSTKLQSITTFSTRDSNEIIGFEIVPNPDQPQFFPSLVKPTSLDPNTGLTTLVATRTGPPGLPPNYIHRIGDITITLGDQLNNDGQVDYRIGVLSAIDANGRDITDQFKSVYQEFEFQPAPVPELSSVFGLVLAGGFGVFLRKQNREVLYIC